MKETPTQIIQAIVDKTYKCDNNAQNVQYLDAKNFDYVFIGDTHIEFKPKQ